MRTATALVIVVGLAIAGCGSSKKDSTQATTAAAMATTASTTPAAKRTALDPIRRRLRAAGMFPAPVNLSAHESDALIVNGVDIMQFASRRPLLAYASFLMQFFSPHPDAGTQKIFGNRLYWTGEDHVMTAKERATFRRVVAVGQGQ